MKNLILSLFILFSVQSYAQVSDPIEINLPAKTINGTKLGMKAKLFTMVYNLDQKYVALNWKVSYYADSSGHYGQKLNLPGISTYTKESIADNRTKVIRSTGEIIRPDSTGAYPLELDLVGQFDFFYNLAENEDINIHDMIRQYGEAVENW